MTAVTEQQLHGVIPDLPEATYHAHPALSNSVARALLPPSCPAIVKWERDHGRPEKRAYDLGHAAHAQILGVGMPVEIVHTTAKDGTTSPAEDYRTKSAQQHRDEAYAAGMVPLLATEVEQVAAMAAALRAHPWASALFDPDRGGAPEQSLFWFDEAYDIDRRARLDWLPPTGGDGRLIVPDYKSTVSAEPRSIAKSVYNYGYFMQDVFYTDGLRALGVAEDVAFVFVFQETRPPYLITVAECDAEAKRLGRLRVDQACEVWAECTATDTWPGYSNDVELVSLPRWATYEMDLT